MKIHEKLEAIIFFSGEPIAIELLAETLESTKEEIVENIEKLIKEKYSDENSGIELVVTDGLVQFVARKEALEYINKIFDTYMRNVKLFLSLYHGEVISMKLSILLYC